MGLPKGEKKKIPHKKLLIGTYVQYVPLNGGAVHKLCTYMISVILLPVHPASFAHKFLFQRVPGCNSMADLSLKIVFWTH